MASLFDSNGTAPTRGSHTRHARRSVCHQRAHGCLRPFGRDMFRFAGLGIAETPTMSVSQATLWASAHPLAATGAALLAGAGAKAALMRRGRGSR